MTEHLEKGGTVGKELSLRTTPTASGGLTLACDEMSEIRPKPLQDQQKAVVKGRGSSALGGMPKERYPCTPSQEAS